MRALTSLIKSTDQAVNEDPYADLAPESAVATDATSQQDWFSEFPDEEPAPVRPVAAMASRPEPRARATSWLALSRTMKDGAR